jgi:hypothetical protein
MRPLPIALVASVLGVALSARQSARRQFVSADTATALLRVYQGGRRAPLSATIATHVIDDKNADVASDVQTIAAADFSRIRSADYRYILPTRQLAPGEYLLRMTATVGKDASERAIRFTVK